ncbi:MAG TPA: alpha/beta hydrolase [Opitutaceae bacterium]|nr:alpha/beta hydrolase [Opitutaceae bacterium]
MDEHDQLLSGVRRRCAWRRGRAAGLAALAAGLWSAHARAADGPALRDVPYLGAGAAGKLDLYEPAGSAGAHLRPAIVYIHGGGWVKGDKAGPRDRHVAAALASGGYVVASIDYALGDGVWPKNLSDCRNAVRFVRANAARYRIDPNRIAVVGASAGAHLALMVGFTDPADLVSRTPPYPGVSCAVDAIVELYGITDLLTRRKPEPDGTPDGPPDTLHAAQMLGIDPREGAKLWRDASPVTHVRPGLPPVLIAHGLSDTIVDYPQAVELANALRACGVPHQLVLIEGVGHMFDLDEWHGQPLPVPLRRIVLDFLGQR